MALRPFRMSEHSYGGLRIIKRVSRTRTRLLKRRISAWWTFRIRTQKYSNPARTNVRCNPHSIEQLRIVVPPAVQVLRKPASLMASPTRVVHAYVAGFRSRRRLCVHDLIRLAQPRLDRRCEAPLGPPSLERADRASPQCGAGQH